MSLWFHADNAIVENESLADDCCGKGILSMLRHSPVVVELCLRCRVSSNQSIFNPSSGIIRLGDPRGVDWLIGALGTH